MSCAGLAGKHHMQQQHRSNQQATPKWLICVKGSPCDNEPLLSQGLPRGMLTNLKRLGSQILAVL